MWQVASAAVILATPVLVGVYDLVAYLRAGDPATISRVSLQTAAEYPPFKWCLCLLFGAFLAHLFVSSPGPRPLPVWVALPLVVGVPLAVTFATLVLGLRTPDAPAVRSQYQLVEVLVWTTLGCLLGAGLLSQTAEQ